MVDLCNCKDNTFSLNFSTPIYIYFSMFYYEHAPDWP